MRTPERTAHEIRHVYERTAAQRGTLDAEWMTMRTVADHLDATPDQIQAGIQHLVRTDPRFLPIEEQNQKTLTTDDRAVRIKLGLSYVDAMRWV